jgi:hypothetical protein
MTAGGFMTGLEVSIDGKSSSPVSALERAGIQGVVFTGPNHTDRATRWRILLPASAPLPATARDRLHTAATSVLGQSATFPRDGVPFGSVSYYRDHTVSLVEGRYLDTIAPGALALVNIDPKPSRWTPQLHYRLQGDVTDLLASVMLQARVNEDEARAWITQTVAKVHPRQSRHSLTTYRRSRNAAFAEEWWLRCLRRGFVFDSRKGQTDFFHVWHPRVTMLILKSSYEAFAADPNDRFPTPSIGLGKFFSAIGGIATSWRNCVIDESDDGPVVADRRKGWHFGDLAQARNSFCQHTGTAVVWK